MRVFLSQSFQGIEFESFLEKMASNTTESKTVDFSGISFEEKKRIILDSILRATNFNDPVAETLDWSTSTMPLFVRSSMVLSFIHKLDFERICGRLNGKKTIDEIIKIVFNFENE